MHRIFWSHLEIKIKINNQVKWYSKKIINKSNIKDVLLENDRIKFNVLNKLKNYKYDVIIIAVAHKYFKNIGIKRIRGFLSDKNNIIFDVKNLFKKDSNNYISL